MERCKGSIPVSSQIVSDAHFLNQGNLIVYFYAGVQISDSYYA